MKPPRAIQYKAFFLLVTFSMNTVIGFACSMGVDMGFNAHHHHSHEAGKHHEHSDADHHEEHDGENSHSHQHEAIEPLHLDTGNNTAFFTSQDEGNCCKDYVVGFNSVDKQLAKQNSTQLKITYLSPFIATFCFTESTNEKGYLQHLRIPPREIDYSPPDIRVFIQSFLI
ncbi:hypothetical protein [Ferruginibacter profundus]